MPKDMILVLLTTCVLISASAQKKADNPQAVTLRGYLVDAMCGDVYATKKNPFERAKGHTRECGLEEACSASGYGMMTDKEWVKFDAGGNVEAKKALQASKRTRGLLFEVTGTKKENLLSVKALKETDNGEEGAHPQTHEGHKH